MNNSLEWKKSCNIIKCLLTRKNIKNKTLKELEKILDKCCSKQNLKSGIVQKTRNIVWYEYSVQFLKQFNKKKIIINIVNENSILLWK